MFLVELVLQGIRGFQQLARVRFQGGFNFVAAGNESGKTTSVDTIVRLLFPVNQPGKMDYLVSRPAPETSRGALVVYSDDSAYYRVIQDFTKRAVNLSKYNPGTKEFTLLQKDWDATAGFMAGLLPGISEEDYGRLFVLRRDACAGPAGLEPQVATATPGPRGRTAAASSGRTPGQEARLAELRETLRKAEEAADAEYRFDAAKMRLGEIAKKIESVEEERGRAGELEAQIEELKACEMLPENLADLISTHEQEEGQKTAKLGELAQDIEALTLQRDSVPTVNLMTDKLFLAGVAVLCLAIITGLFIPLEGSDLYFPLGVLGALLLIVAGWYNSSRKNAQRNEVQKEIDHLVKERAEVEKKFQDSGAAIIKYMQATGAKSAAELKEKAENYHYFQNLYQELQEHQQRTLGGLDAEALRAEYARQQEEVAALGKAAKALAHHAVDTYSVRQEIDRIESEFSPGAQDLGFSGPALDIGAAPAAPAAAGGPGMNILAEIAVASRVSGIEMETLVPAAESAAQRNLSAASAGRYVRVEVGPDGLPIVHDRNGAKLVYAALSHGTRELACFCLRAGVVEAVAGKRRLPFLLDDPFTGMDLARQQAACQILRALATKTQVILFTSNPSLKAPNDFAAELK